MSNFKTCLVQDSRIANITDVETYAVMAGPSQSNYQNFAATSASSSALIWNVQIPSENIVIDRHLLIQSTVTLTLNLVFPDALDDGENVLVFDYGLTDSLQAFPLNSLCNTQQMTINNCTVSQNTKDILPMLLRMYDKRKLNRYNSTCPSLPDSYYSEYKNGLGCLNNVLAGYNNSSLDDDFQPRGSFPVKILSVVHGFTEDGTAETDDMLVFETGTTNNVWSIVLQFTTTEPFICLSPWINTNSNNQAGLVGVNNISANLSIDSTCKRVFSTMNEYIQSISLGATIGTTVYQPFTDSKLLFNFLSLQPEDYRKVSSKNCIPYMDYPRYLSSTASTTSIAAIVIDGTTGLATLSSTTLTSQSLQLSMIPDLILITVRKPMSTQDWTDSSSFLTINSISISFNNTAGILSSANPQQLYEISYRNGSAQSYYEFAGLAKSNYTGEVNSYGNITYSQDLVGRGVQVGTTGSLLVLNPVLDFNLPSYLSSGSLGQFNLYFTINVSNQTNQIIIAPEICIVCCNSGIFTTQLGSSVVNTGILTKEEVLRTKEQEPIMDNTDHKRYVGGNLTNFGMGNMYKLLKSKVLPYVDDKLNDIMGSSGSGMSGGVVQSSGGRIRKRDKLSKHYA